MREKIRFPGLTPTDTSGQLVQFISIVGWEVLGGGRVEERRESTVLTTGKSGRLKQSYHQILRKY